MQQSRLLQQRLPQTKLMKCTNMNILKVTLMLNNTSEQPMMTLFYMSTLNGIIPSKEDAR